jgi:hypothetical protein
VLNQAEVDGLVASVRALSPEAVRERRAVLVRRLFFDAELLPATIEELTGVTPNTVRNLCRGDDRYEAQVARNRRRHHAAANERWAAIAGTGEGVPRPPASG